MRYKHVAPMDRRAFNGKKRKWEEKKEHISVYLTPTALRWMETHGKAEVIEFLARDMLFLVDPEGNPVEFNG